MQEQFKYVGFEGCLSMDDTLTELTHLAGWMKRSHGSEAATKNPDRKQHKILFHNRKVGIIALMDQIEKYIEQIPEVSESVRVRFNMTEQNWVTAMRQLYVDDFRPKHIVEQANNSYFIIKYESQDDFELALRYFGGKVTYTILDQEKDL